MTNIIRKPLSEISVSEEQRIIEHSKVLELVESIKIIGLLQPIGIDMNGMLVYGGHRLEAHKLLGRNEIECVV